MGISRKTEIYKINIQKTFLGENTKLEELLSPKSMLKSFFEYYFNNYVYTVTNDKKYKLKGSNICYYMSSAKFDGDLINVTLNYMKFNKRTKVVNVDSLTSSYTKDKEEGDEEYQHFVIKYFDNQNRAVLVFEKISGAVTMGMLRKNINRAYREWIKNCYSGDENKDIRNSFLDYKINISIVPNPDFIKELEKMDKISLIKITVDKEDIQADDEIKFAEENISRDEVELIYKPVRGLSFSRLKVKSYYRQMENNKTNTKIKRMVISGRGDGNPISLDTERMKLSKYIDTIIDVDGFVKAEDLFEKYKTIVNNNTEEYFGDICIDIDESEE